MSYLYPDTCLLIFAKAPVAGEVKTRLIPSLGAKGACQLYEKMMHDIVERFATSELCEINLLCHPDTEHSFFKEIASDFDLKLFPQQGKDLGERMFQATAHALKFHKKVIVIGTDCPAYSKEYIEEAINSLEQKNVVLGPAFDGGYVLIGMKKKEPHIFSQVKWGENTVLNKTLENIRDKNLTYLLMRSMHDIDVPADLQYLK